MPHARLLRGAYKERMTDTVDPEDIGYLEPNDRRIELAIRVFKLLQQEYDGTPAASVDVTVALTIALVEVITAVVPPDRWHELHERIIWRIRTELDHFKREGYRRQGTEQQTRQH